jgi:hypothetical protein
MEDPQTWQELLSSVIQNPSELHRIAREMEIHPITLIRWVHRKSTPRLTNLHLMLDAMPQQRYHMLTLVQKAFPNFSPEHTLEENIVPEIPTAFYDNVLNIYTNSAPILRTSSICFALFQQIFCHLDPFNHGLRILLYQCMSSGKEGEKIHSLRLTLGRSTYPSESSLENSLPFLGIESQTGTVVSTGHPIVTQSAHEHMQKYSIYEAPHAESIAAYPLLSFDQIAGALCIISTQKNQFTPLYQEVIQRYTKLFVLAFDQSQFYPLHDIHLGIMPPNNIQQHYVAQFREDVNACILKAEKMGYPLHRADAELLVWKQQEETLLCLPSSSQEVVSSHNSSLKNRIELPLS